MFIMRREMLLTALLLYLISAVKMQEDEPDEQAEEQPSLDELLDRQISVSASQCDAEDQCQCTVDAPQPCAYDAEYAELVRARAQLDIVYAHVHGEVVEGIKVDLAALIVRMSSLETSLHNQSISLSMSELAGLQDQVSSMQTTLTQLALSVNSTVTQRLVAEVELIQASLLELGTKNPIAVRADVEKELSALRARVASCSTITSVHQEGALDFIGDGLPYNQTITTGHCPANGNITIGTPVTYKFRNIQAMWLKDPLPVSDEEKTKIYETRSYAARNQYLYSFNNLNDYESTNFLTKQTQSSCGFNLYGQKPLYINGVFYWYDMYSSSRFIRRMSSLYGKTCPHLASPDRYPDVSFDYNGHAHNDVDLNFDETGLYAVYADSNGDMDIARLNEDTLEREQVWKTGKQKRAVANVFMVCGRLYSIDDYKSRHLSGLQWGYDTKTGEEFTFEMDVESKFGAIQALSYNPREKALFGWDNGHAVLYPVFF